MQVNSGSNAGVNWRKRNDKVITFDMQRPNGVGQFHKSTNGWGADRGSTQESPLKSMINTRMVNSTFTPPFDEQQTQPPIYAQNRRQGNQIDDSEINGSTFGGPAPMNGSFGKPPQSSGNLEVKPELAAKFLQMLNDVGNEDFDQSDLKDQDSLVKRSEIIRKGIANYKNEARKAEAANKRADDMQKKYEEAMRLLEDHQREQKRANADFTKELDQLNKELAKRDQVIQERNDKIESLEKDIKGRSSIRDSATSVDPRASEQARQIESLEKELASANGHLKIKEQEIQQRNDQIADLKKEQKKKDDDLAETTKKLKEVERRYDEIERTKTTIETKEADASKREAELKKQNEELRKEIEALKKKVAELEEEKKRLLQKAEETEIAHKKQLREAQEEKEKLEKEIKELKDKIARMEKANSEKDSILGKLASQIMELNRTRTQIDDK